MLPICTIAGNSARPAAPVRFRAASLSYMLPAGPSATRDRGRTAGLAPRAGGTAGVFTMGKMLALPFLTCVAVHAGALLPGAVGAVPG
jgi:hypothetical protein